MVSSFPFVVLMLTIFLAACGNEGASAPDTGASNTPGPGAQTVSHPLATLTAERLDAYIDILRAAAVDPDKDNGEIAMERGWSIGEWISLDTAVADVAAEGYEQMLERQRTKSKEAREQIADYESRLARASEGDRPMIEQSVAILRNAVAGWEQTLADADVLRPGGNLVESRLADIKAAKEQ